MPTDRDIFERPAVTPRTRTRDLLSIGSDIIKATTDDLAAVCVERLCEHLADVADDLAVSRLMLSESQAVAYDRHIEVTRLRQRVADLLDLARGRQ